MARGEVDVVACRRPVALPEGWQFTALREDRFVVVCRPGHPVLRRRRVDWHVLGRETWMLAPAETAARLRFDELAQRFEAPPRAHPLVTRSLPLMYGTLASEPMLALLPASIVGPAVRAGQFALAPMPEVLPLDPLGVLLPERGSAKAVPALVEHLQRAASGDGAAQRLPEETR